MTRLTGSAPRGTVLIGENDTWHRKPLCTEIVHRARAAGLAGAGVFRGVEGFGASSLMTVDAPDRVRAFLPQPDTKGKRSL